MVTFLGAIVSGLLFGRGNPLPAMMILLVVGCTVIATLLFQIMMWVAAFGSDSECGPALYKFAILTVPIAALQLGSQFFSTVR